MYVDGSGCGAGVATRCRPPISAFFFRSCARASLSGRRGGGYPPRVRLPPSRSCVLRLSLLADPDPAATGKQHEFPLPDAPRPLPGVGAGVPVARGGYGLRSGWCRGRAVVARRPRAGPGWRYSNCKHSNSCSRRGCGPRRAAGARAREAPVSFLSGQGPAGAVGGAWAEARNPASNAPSGPLSHR